MSDERLRELERRWKETGTAGDEVAYLLERVRLGEPLLPAVFEGPVDDDTSHVEKIEELIELVGWEHVRTELLQVLEEDQDLDHARIAAEAIWGGLLDGREMPGDRVIALLYHRFDPAGNEEDNLAWSITAKIKGFPYQADYDPLADPDVQRELSRIRGGSDDELSQQTDPA